MLLIYRPILLDAGNVGKTLLFNSILIDNITIIEDKIFFFDFQFCCLY